MLLAVVALLCILCGYQFAKVCYSGYCSSTAALMELWAATYARAVLIGVVYTSLVHTMVFSAMWWSERELPHDRQASGARVASGERPRQAIGRTSSEETLPTQVDLCCRRGTLKLKLR